MQFENRSQFGAPPPPITRETTMMTSAGQSMADSALDSQGSEYYRLTRCGGSGGNRADVILDLKRADIVRRQTNRVTAFRNVSNLSGHLPVYQAATKQHLNRCSPFVVDVRGGGVLQPGGGQGSVRPIHRRSLDTRSQKFSSYYRNLQLQAQKMPVLGTSMPVVSSFACSDTPALSNNAPLLPKSKKLPRALRKFMGLESDGHKRSHDLTSIGLEDSTSGFEKTLDWMVHTKVMEMQDAPPVCKVSQAHHHYAK